MDRKIPSFSASRPLGALFLAAVLLLPVSTPTRADEGASGWSRVSRAAVRLLDGGLRADGAHLAGLEIVLEPHVKTYWRVPGDSGLPPRFDWDGSTNLASVDIKWPVPQRFDDPSGSSIGYVDRVIFPLIIRSSHPSEPVRLLLHLDFAVCDTLCVPVIVDSQINLANRAPSPAVKTSIEAFLAKAPREVAFHDASTPRLISIKPSPSEPDQLLLTAEPPTGGTLQDILIDAPEGWYIGQGVPVSPTGNTETIWRVPVEQKPEGATLNSLPLTITLIADGEATETAVRLDETGAIQ